MMWPQMSREELWVTRLAKLTRGGRCAGLPDNSRTYKIHQIGKINGVLVLQEIRHTNDITFGL